MPADDAKFQVKPKLYRKETMVKQVKCPQCSDGFMTRDEHDTKFALRDRFRSPKTPAFVHECSKCKHTMVFDSCYPKEFERLVLINEDGSGSKD